jgi:hypothetical protein
MFPTAVRNNKPKRKIATVKAAPGIPNLMTGAIKNANSEINATKNAVQIKRRFS